MNPEQFLQVADCFPDPAILLTKDGILVGANRSTRSLWPHPEDITGRSLGDLTSTPSDVVRDYIRRCSRSREPVIGALVLLPGLGQQVPCLCHGSIAHHDPQGGDTRILLRLTRKDSAPSRFAILSQKIEEL